tara:strand:- start:4374 stop:5108 length:735 start_codon:yes stop_codon:yes gene_type:complete
MPILTVVIPCYNESRNIPLLLQRFKEVLESRKDKDSIKDDIQLLLVDNGSNDSTQDVLNNLLPDYNFASSINLKLNKGYGNGIIEGLKAAKSDYLGWTHADLQTDMNDIFTSMEYIKQNDFSRNIFIKGVRKNRSFFDNIFSIGMSLFESILFGLPIYEVNAQPNVFHSSLIDNLDDMPKDFAIDLYLYICALKNRSNIIRFNVNFPQRIFGASKWDTGIKSKFKYVLRTLVFSLRLKKIKFDK